MNERLEILEVALEDRRTTSSDLLFLTFLALRGPGEYTTTNLTETLRISRTALFGSLAHLSTLGYLVIERKTDNGKLAANFYRPTMPSVQEERSSRPEEEQRWDIDAVCKLIAQYNVTGYSLLISRRRIVTAALALMELPGFSPDNLLKLYERPSGLWYTNDWRGKQGQSPSPEQLVSSWPQLYAASTAATPAVFNDDGSVYL